MKKLIIILCFLPLFSYSGNIYKALADTVFIGSIPYKTATGELIIFNSTKDTAGVLYNNGSGVTQFKKVRSIKLNDSTYVIKIGTSVIGDTIKILSSASSGGTVTDFTFTDGNGFDGTVTNSTTTPTLVLVADTLTKFASVMRLLDSITAINARVASKGSGTVTNVGSGYGTNFSAITSTGSIIVDSTVIGTKTYINTKFAQTAVGTVTSVATDNTLTGGTITSTGTLKVDTSRISTKGNVTGLLLNKQDNLISGTTIKTINSTSLLGSGNITTPDAQTLSLARDTLSISNGNSLKLPSTIFQNGGKIIEDTTYEITHSDAGYLLYFPYETTVTHSIANPLIESDVIGVQFYDPNSIITMDATLVELYLYSQLQSGDAEKGEVAIFQAIQDGEILPLFGVKTDESDGGKLKTITRYLYDKDTLSLGTGVTTYLAQTRAFQTLTDGATVTYNITNGYNAKVTLGGNRTLSITNAAAGDYGTLIVIQDGSGSKTLTLPAGSKVISGGAGAITLTTTANAIDVLSWFYDGTNYYWTYGKNYN